MTLSLESIHQPMTDFFLNLFKTDFGSPIVFRFDKFGSIVSEQDFIHPQHPELGYLPQLAREKFSDLVNHIPVDTGDGVNILFSSNSIDTTYFLRLLGPAIPFFPPGIDADTQQAIIKSFSSIKEYCVDLWKSLKLESSTGLVLQFKPALATPENWGDKSKNDAWTSHSFQVTETSDVPASGSSSQLWRMKLSDTSMAQVLQLPQEANRLPDLSGLNIAERVLELHANPLIDIPVENQPTFSVAARPTLDSSLMPANSVSLHDRYLEEYRTLDVSNKLIARQRIGSNAPTRSVQTSSISISFDYCLVHIQRPWYVDVFINDKSWCIPNVLKGELTSSGPASNLTLLPIGFVAIRNLNIEANWATEDIASASQATDFGPFEVTADIVNNKLSHPGLQIIGWVLQRMPDLPPNNGSIT